MKKDTFFSQDRRGCTLTSRTMWWFTEETTRLECGRREDEV